MADRKIIFMADSYGDYYKDSIHYSWTEHIISTLGLTESAINLSQGSRGFAFNPVVGTFETGLKNNVENNFILEPSKIERIIICGGANDMSGIALGLITEIDLNNAIQSFMTYAKTTFPNARITIGMNGNCNVGSYETPYFKVLKAYKNATKYGADYMKNLEHVLKNPALIDDSGIHPTAEGFQKLYSATIDCIQSGSCDVTNDLENVIFTIDTTRGTWNTTPSMAFSHKNDIVTLISKVGGVEYTFFNPVSFDEIIGSDIVNGFKLIRLGKINNVPLRGGHFGGNTGNKYKILGYIYSRLQTSTWNPLVGTVPLIMSEYDLYIGVSDCGDNAYWNYQAPSNKFFTGATTDLKITGIVIDGFKIDVNIGMFDYIS